LSSGNRRAVAYAYMVLDAALVGLGHSDAASHTSAALEIWESLGDLGNQAVLLNNVGHFAHGQGRWDVALDHYRRSQDLSARIGNVVDAAVTTSNIAAILADQGRLGEAEEHLDAASELFHSVCYDVGVALTERHRGRIETRRANVEKALRHLQSAREVFARDRLAAKVLEVDAWIAECKLRRGDIAGAVLLIEDTDRRERAMGGTEFLPMLNRLRGYAATARRAYGEARRAIQESVRQARARAAKYDVALGLEALDVIALMDGRPPNPRHALERARLADELGVVWTALPPIPPEAASAAAPT
jgi:tetratricopeptide (TPR) repeat protein